MRSGGPRRPYEYGRTSLLALPVTGKNTGLHCCRSSGQKIKSTSLTRLEDLSRVLQSCYYHALSIPRLFLHKLRCAIVCFVGIELYPHFNYRHIEDDINPGVCKEEGFRLLDRVVERCARKNLNVVRNMHAVPGGRNQDWHSNSGFHKALIWQHKDFQAREEFKAGGVGGVLWVWVLYAEGRLM